MNAHLKMAFPALEAEGFTETSSASAKYNCIAWAAGDQSEWWWPYVDPAYYWPAGQPREVTLDTFVGVFASLGYEPCDNGGAEADVEKVAIYALSGKPTHAARQLADGRWTSKLGKDIDISHSVRGLEGPVYGQVAIYLKRSAGKATGQTA